MSLEAENYIPVIENARGYHSKYPISMPVTDTGGQVYNVKGFNAKGDGVTDDTLAIQTTINTCIDAGGGIVFFPVGLYRISNTLNIIGNYCTLMGPYYNRDFSDYSVWPGTDNDGLGMSGIKVLSNFPSGNTIIKVGNSAQTYYTLGGGIDSLYISGDSNVVTAPSPNLLGGIGIEEWNAHDFKIRNVCIERLRDKGVYAQGTLPGGVSMAEVDDCLIRNTSGYGIHFDSGMIINRITRNFLATCTGLGIYNAGNNNIIQANHIETTGLKGGDVSVSGTGIANTGAAATINYNEVGNSDYHGIWISNSALASVVTNNRLETSNQGSHGDGSGIYFSDGSTNSTVCIGNVCYDTSGKVVYGIFDHTSAGTGVQISDNSITGFTTAAIGVQNVGISPIGFNNGCNPRVLKAKGNVTGATTFDRSNGDHQTATQTGDITVTLTSGKIVGDVMTLEIVTGGHAQTWPGNLKLAGGAYAMTGTSTLTIRWDGTNWVEQSRAANIS